MGKNKKMETKQKIRPSISTGIGYSPEARMEMRWQHPEHALHDQYGIEW